MENPSYVMLFHTHIYYKYKVKNCQTEMSDSLYLAIKPSNRKHKQTTYKKTKILKNVCPGATHISFSTRIPPQSSLD